jgi:hypothetical protein
MQSFVEQVMELEGMESLENECIGAFSSFFWNISTNG